jgi:hypothetical protein
MLATNNVIFTAMRVVNSVLSGQELFCDPHQLETMLRGSYHYIRRQIPAVEQRVRELHERLGVHMRGDEDLVAFHRRVQADKWRPRTTDEAVLDWWNGRGERSVPHQFHVFLRENGPRRVEDAAARMNNP